MFYALIDTRRPDDNTDNMIDTRQPDDGTWERFALMNELPIEGYELSKV